MIKILTVAHCLFEATHMAQKLTEMGHPATIVDGVDIQDESLYIIYNACGMRRMPKNYIVAQTEICGSHWFGPSYHRILRNARAIWDYSQENIQAYHTMNPNVCIVPPGIHPQKHMAVKDIEFLFYGWITGSPRRRRIVDQLASEMNLTVVTNKLGKAMWEILARARTVINVHYYDHSPLELYRLHESLSFGCDVYLQDEQRLYTYDFINTKAIKHGLKIAGYDLHSEAVRA